MAAPLAPIAVHLIRIGAVAAVAYYVARHRHAAPLDQRRDDAHEDTPEGIDLAHHQSGASAQMDGSARWKRTIRIGQNGSGIEIDASALGRIKISRK